MDKVDKVILSTNENVTMTSEGQKGNKKKREKNISLDFERESGSGGKKISFRERRSNFSLEFLTIGPSVLVGPRSKVVLRCKGYVWASLLGSFDNSGR